MISNLAKIAAASLLNFFPFLTMVAGSFIVIFPPSIPAFIFNFPSSEIIGPAGRSVGPALIVISCGAVCPAFAFAGNLLSEIIQKDQC